MTEEELPKEHRRSRRWWRWAVGALLFLWGAGAGLSWLAQHSRLHRRLTERLEAAFGRPVEVGSDEISLWEGPRLEARLVTVGEDPRFGAEYFLRARKVSVRLRWQGLVRGRIEFGTLSFTSPSLNLVHAPDGRWNLEEWLPRPPARNAAGAAASSGPPSSPAGRLERIEVKDGRINFKRGADKLPFALIHVNGKVEQAGGGRWRLNLAAQTARAIVSMQQAGTLRLQGTVGGISSRLRPAHLLFSWSDASLSDVLRLARGYDYGVRGSFSAHLAARTEGDSWFLEGRTELRRVHRWDLPLRPDDPTVNLAVSAIWSPSQSRLEINRLVAEAPRSNLHASGFLEWRAFGSARAARLESARFRLFSPGIHLGDLFLWYRAFHAGVAGEIGLSGMVGVDAQLSGWPPKVERGAIASDGFSLEGGSLRVPVHVSRTVIHLARRSFDLEPVTLSLGGGEGTLRVAALSRGGMGAASFRVSGQIADVRDVVVTAGALGWNSPVGWRFSGPARLNLQWNGKGWPSPASLAGRIELDGLSLRAPFLNEAISQIKGRMTLGAQGKQLTLASAQGFGGHWSGTFSRGRSDPEWKFDLKTDRLEATELARWLDPRWREGLLERLFPFLATKEISVPSWLRAQGRLSVGQLDLAPFDFLHLVGDANLQGRRIEFRKLQASLDGGSVGGSAQITLESEPVYHLETHFDRMNLGALAPSLLRDRYSGVASGDASFDLRGLGRAALLHSLGCRGRAELRNGQIRGLDLLASLAEGAARAGTTHFSRGSASFTCGGGRVRISRLRLESGKETLELSGDVDARQNLDFTVRWLSTPAQVSSSAEDYPRPRYRIVGTLRAPKFTRIASAGRAR